MSDLSMYELEDIIWDDFNHGDDHIVPHPTNARTSRNSFEGDSCKKPQCETSPVFHNTGNLDASYTICQGKSERDCKPVDKKKNMMENESHISQTEDLCFVENNCEDKESGDLLYYSWPDIGNFEDVDKMLRSCDSSFGLDVTENDDELGWFTSDQTMGTEEALKMDFKFPCPEPSCLIHILQDHDSPELNNHRFSCISENKNELNYKDQKKQSKHQNQTEGNDGSFYQMSDLTSNDSRFSSNNKFDQFFSSVGNGHQYRNLEVDYFGQILSGIKSEDKGVKSPSLMGSSYASNQGYSMESSGDHLFDRTAAEVDERKQAHDSLGFQPLFMESSRQVGMMFKSSKGVLESVQKGVEIGSLRAPESFSVGSVLDEISLEATSFRQLQQVMEQLDLRTKLCIRDSLYRLARSAEQRHNNPSLSSAPTDIDGPLMADKCIGFMDMETDTNPIDRSVAHLLFHRPSESPNFPAPLHPKPNLNHGSVAGPSMMAEKLVCQEEVVAESNDKMGGC